VEGRSADEELVRENAQTPDVDALVVTVALNHLGRKIVESTEQCAALKKEKGKSIEEERQSERRGKIRKFNRLTEYNGKR
jgi:hypothetical protein